MINNILLILIFLLFLFLGLPVGFAIILSTLSGLIIQQEPLALISQRFFTAIDSFSLMAIPLFMFAGSIMSKGTITKRLIDFALVIFYKSRGALAKVVTVTGIVMGGISGSGVADTAALGSILFPEMKDRNYDQGFSAAVIASSGSIGLIIPPSIALIVYGVSTQTSIGDLFMGGLIPGVLIGLCFLLYCHFIATKNNYPKENNISKEEKIKKFKDSIFALFMPIIIIVGIRGGIFTPTEGGAIVSMYALIISIFVYKDIKLKDLKSICLDAALSTAAITLIICATSALTWFLASNEIPQRVSMFIISLTDNKLALILLMSFLLLIVGMFIDSSPAIMMLSPILYPIASSIGINPVQFGVFMVILLTVGLLTPPVGTALYVVSNISKISIEKISKSLMPFWAIMISVAIFVALFPILTLS
ncbi:MAG: TRAP transporter large permease subunit [Anaerococcus vaginalis]|uniref:TRAP transporter large permease n=1 Tax=Anaerococcus vaginalis TaxID=33037 RepID=UPI00290BF093|nr:TRAP transporter large permease subunit [Anaerococcus vaginalis]MDU4447086.1 TRAP transporter large permease subunit [Anaerococcus vaginalis]MDU6181901.1 TRAP transporter large permease subunit [Anaerococcus vaginalis]MDU7432733.1 TRAP transporter large permease subunit [Anaerococcus vaginalis]